MTEAATPTSGGRPQPSPIAAGTVPWPAEVAERYVQRGWWRELALGTELWTVADAWADAPAVIDGDVRLTYAELIARADAAASRMVDELGFRVGDRIVVQLANCWQFVVLTLACLRAGIVPVMALPAHRHHEMRYLIDHSEAVSVAVPGELRGFDYEQLGADLLASCPTLHTVLTCADEPREAGASLSAVCASPTAGGNDRQRWDDAAPGAREVAVFLLSGGTTGLPKLIARTHNDYAYNARASAELCAFDTDTVYLVSLPASHNFPLACPGILGTLLAGGRVVMLASPEPERAFATIAAESVTVTAAVPVVAQRWISHANDVGAEQLRSLTLLQVGGARLADEIARQVRPVLGCTLQQVFGMAEGLLNYTRLSDPEDVLCSTQGRPLSEGDEIRLVDEDDRDVPDAESGSLLTRGPYTPRGYYRAEEQNARAFTTDGWYRSGDIVGRHLGNLVVEGREKDMINRGGEKISAEEVENLIYQLPEVGQVAAVAMPDPELGERVCVFVVPVAARQRVTLEDVRALMERAQVGRYKWPERLEIVSELPTTKVGKIDKVALRADIAARLSLS